jgi:glutathione S-transferase
MKLYYSPGACSLAPHIVLREAGLPFSLEKVDTSTHKTAQGVDYYTINPKGQVPVLEIEDGERLSEGPIVAQYVADQAKNTDLMPAAGTKARYRVMEWQNYVTSELHKSFTPLFNPAVNAEAKGVIAENLKKKYRWVSTQLEGREYLTGSTFTVADAYLFTVSGWAKHVGLDLSDLSHLQKFLSRVAARPAVKEAMRAEGLPV